LVFEISIVDSKSSWWDKRTNGGFMVDTNALLSVAFSLIANFTNIVHVPPAAVPQSASGVESCVIGTPYSPVDVYIRHRKGTEFWISDGIVEQFRSPGSFFQLQNLDIITRYLGAPQLNSNQVLELATRTLQKLVRNGNPLANREPIVKEAGKYRETPIPFYRFTWPARKTGTTGATSTKVDLRSEMFGFIAEMEIDARTGEIEQLFLIDRSFHDYAFAEQITNRVYKPEPKPVEVAKKRTGQRILPVPATNEIIRAIGKWLLVCERMGVNPGSQTNLTDVNWDQSCLYPFKQLSSKTSVCRVCFNNGTQFDTFNGIVINHCSWDECYRFDWQQRSREEWGPFMGKITEDWRNLAKNFEKLLKEKFGFPERALSPYEAGPHFKPYDVGTEEVIRLPVEWRQWPKRHLKPDEMISIEESKRGLVVEFDLRTGEIKMFSFWDPKLINLFDKAQDRP
jgi:hypothetical protein